MPHRISKSLHRSSCSASFQAFVFLQLESKISFKATRYRDRHIGLKHCIQELKRRYSIRPMFLVIFLLTCTAHVSSLQISRSHLSISNRIATISTTLSLSSFDKDMTELNKLSRTELQTLSKEYGLKATLKTADLIINLEAAISSINSLEKSSLPSATDTLKFSPLEKTSTIKSTDVNSAKYKVENSNPNIGDILKEQGVRIDDLMALRDSLMKGGFKFNDDEDEVDFGDSDEELSEEDIDREFYGEDFDSETPRLSRSSGESRGSSKTAVDAIAQEAERSAANTLKSKAIKEAKRLAKLDGKPASKPRKVEAKVKPPRPAAGYERKSPMSSLDDLLLSELLGAEFREDEDIFKQLGGVDVGNQRSMVHDSDRDNGDEKKEDSRRVSSKAVAVSMPAVEIETKTEKETATVTPVKSVAEPVYVKLKRRVIEEEEEGEGAGESDTLGDLDRFMSLEDLGNRMDELYGDSDGDSDPGSEPTEGPVSAVAKVVKGSDSKNPIKWRNGRLVNDKDRFYGEIRSQAISDSSSEDEVDEDSDDSSSSGSGSEGRKGSDGDSESARSGVKKASKSGSKKVTVELTGVTMKLMLEHLETSIGFDGLFEETNLRCFSEKPSVNSSLKVLRQLPLEWARKKIEYLYIQSKKRQ